MGKFRGGTRVRIKVGNWLRPSPYSEVWKYDNLTGEIVNSEAVIGYFVQTLGDANEPFQLIQAYKVRLDVGIEVDYVIEDCLEPLASA